MATDNREEFAESVEKYLSSRRMYEFACHRHANLLEGPGWFAIAAWLIVPSAWVAIVMRLAEGEGVGAAVLLWLIIISVSFFAYVVLEVQAVQRSRNQRVEWSIRLLISVMRMTSFRKDIVWSASNERYLYSDASVYACRTTQPSAPVGGAQRENTVFEAECGEIGKSGYFLYMKCINLSMYDFKDAYYELDRLDDIQAAIFEAAEQGQPYAQYVRGTLEKDRAVAAQWVRRAADAGLAEAQYDLGSRAEAGAGVPQNLVFAYVWLHRAILNGADSGAKWNLDMVVEKMTTEQVAEVKRLARKLNTPSLTRRLWIARAKKLLLPLVKMPGEWMGEWMMKCMESNYWPLIFIVPILLGIVLIVLTR